MAEKWIARQSSQSMWSISEGDAVSSRAIAMSISRKTDAHLIAAAPLMLEALEAVYPHLTELDDMPDVYSSGRVDQSIVQQIKAAIAAAKGE